MRTTETEATIEYGQVGLNYEYTACTLDSEIEEKDLRYKWTVTWQQASDPVDNQESYEIQQQLQRVAIVKFLKEGTYTLRCRVMADDAEDSTGAFSENLPSMPVMNEWFAYTACTPDTGLDPGFLEYAWSVYLEVDDEWVEAKEWITAPSLDQRTLLIQFKYPGRYKLEAMVASLAAEDGIQTSNVCEIIIPVEKIGPVEIVQGKNRRFAAIHPEATAPREDMEYQWECEGAEIEFPDKRICRITFGGYGTYTVKVTVTNKWAYDSPQVAIWEIDHSHPSGPELIFPNWKRRYLGARIFKDDHIFLGNPVHGQNYNPHSQANRFWKIWLDDVQGHANKMCLVENESGDLIWELLPYTHPEIPQRWVSVELINIGTGNQFEDDHMDVRLYTIEREEHPYNKMYVPDHRFFYLGVHRRETKRLPYNIDIRLGAEYLKLDEIPQEDRKYIMNVHDISPHW